jgi:hypothetical protein
MSKFGIGISQVIKNSIFASVAITFLTNDIKAELFAAYNCAENMGFLGFQYLILKNKQLALGSHSLPVLR